jgi:HlyD family secretion protein
VEIDLNNPEDVLCDGMYGKASISLEQDKKNLAVPAACIVEHSGRSGGVVFVVRDGIAKRTEVKLGGDNGSQAEIRSGISPGDLVVLPSGTPLEDGMRVTVAEGHHLS